MFFSFDLLNPRLPVGQIWLAAHRKLKSKNEYLMAVEGLQDGISASHASLYRLSP